MVCVPCLILPALLLFAQFLYRRFSFIKLSVQYFFPSLALAEAQSKRDEDEAKRKQDEFWKKTNEEEGDKDETDKTEQVTEGVYGEGASKRKAGKKGSAPAAPVTAAEDQPSTAEGSKKGK